LEKENARLKPLVGELHLEQAVLTDVAKGNFQARSVSALLLLRLWANIRSSPGLGPA